MSFFAARCDKLTPHGKTFSFTFAARFFRQSGRAFVRKARTPQGMKCRGVAEPL